MALFDPSTWFGPQSPYGSPLPQASSNPYNPATAFNYDPTSIRRAAISNALLSAGAAMLGAGPSRTPQNFGTSLGQGVAAGLQGADQGAQQAMQRQQFAQQSASGAQAYKAGQQQLVGGAMNNQFALMKVNGIRSYYKLPPITMDDLTSDPDLMSNPTKGAAPSPVTGATPGVGMQPITGPQPGDDPQVTQAYGQTMPAAQPSATAAPTPSDPYAQQQGDVDTMMQFGMYDEGLKGQLDLDKQRAAAAQAAGVTAATDAATAGGTQAFVANAAKTASDFVGSTEVGQYHTALNNYGPMLKAYDAIGTDNTGAAENDFLNSALKIFNPEANIIRPGMTASLEDMKGIPSEAAKLWQKGFGGGALTDKEKNAILDAAKNHFTTLAKGYGAVVNSIGAQAKSFATPVPEQIWRRDLPPPGTTPPVGYYKSGFIFNGGDPSQPASWMKLP